MLKEISIIVPCFNESIDVIRKTVKDLMDSASKGEVENFQILIIDDGSKNFDYETDWPPQVNVIKHSKNLGYGAALKTGIRKADYNWIGITDADGTYPNDKLHELFQYTDNFEMVIGARDWEQISAVRKFPKRVLTYFASFLAGYDIPDLNSGMRVFKKRLALKFWHLYPDGFSFTSTITMGAITNDYRIYFHKIDYYSRVGDSSIHPIKDTIRFFTLVTRLALYFNPKKFFIPMSIIFFIIGIVRGLRDYLETGSLGGLSIILFFISVQTFFFGILAEIINKTRLYLSNDKT